MNNNTFNPFASVSQEQIQEVMKPITKIMLEDLEKGKGFNNNFSRISRKDLIISLLKYQERKGKKKILRLKLTRF